MRDFEGDGSFGRDDTAVASAPVAERAPAIGSDERRMHVRAYNHWASLLDGRPFPAIDALEPGDLEDFGPNSVLLDFTAGADEPVIAYLGRRLRTECGLEGGSASIEAIPPRSLLSRLTDHYLEIIANRAPIGFEAEFVNQRGLNTLYRGILMPYSSDGETIDFIYGVINWKELAEPELDAELVLEVSQAIRSAPRAEPVPVWADGPHLGDPVDEDEGQAVAAAPSEDDGLADWLEAARQGAHAVRGAESRSHAALYRALGLCYDFAAVAKARPDDYSELLADAGMTAQARAPMTPIVKLVFGVGYDKGRLTEFAAALSQGDRLGLEVGAFGGWLEALPGGLKAAVKAERLARAAATQRVDRTEAAREALRGAEAQASIEIDAGEGEFVLLVARRGDAGTLDVLTAIADEALVASAIRKAASGKITPRAS